MIEGGGWGVVVGGWQPPIRLAHSVSSVRHPSPAAFHCSQVTIGLLAGIAIGKITEYFTSFDFGPVISIKDRGMTGPATVVIQVRTAPGEKLYANVSLHLSLPNWPPPA